MKQPYLLLIVLLSFSSCATLNQINLFSVEDDKTFGNQMYAQIQGDTKEYPLLDSVKYADAYKNVRRIFNTILSSGQVEHAKDFDWSVQIIDADVLNAFACPGGKLYVYKGLIKYLDNEAQLAGVMGHEMAHAACRHSTEQMTKQYGISTISSMLLGQNPDMYLQIAAQLAGNVGGLAFSRTDEYEADSQAVIYLSHTEYNPLGVAGFFEKMQAEQTGNSGKTPEWLSTHPKDENRIKNIKEVWEKNGSKKGNDFTDRYKQWTKAL